MGWSAMMCLIFMFKQQKVPQGFPVKDFVVITDSRPGTCPVNWSEWDNNKKVDVNTSSGKGNGA
jgi:hypothetical protein